MSTVVKNNRRKEIKKMNKNMKGRIPPKFTEWDGIKVGDKVKLIGECVPDVVGVVARVNLDKLMPEEKREMAYGVRLKNPFSFEPIEEWWPIYRDGLVKVDA